MINNDVLRSIRYMLDLSDQKLIDIMQLAAPTFALDKATLLAYLKREGEPGFVECDSAVLVCRVRQCCAGAFSGWLDFLPAWQGPEPPGATG